MLPRQVAIVESGLPCDPGCRASPYRRPACTLDACAGSRAPGVVAAVALVDRRGSRLLQPRRPSARTADRRSGRCEAAELVAKTVAMWREARDMLGFGSTPRLFWYQGGQVVPFAEGRRRRTDCAHRQTRLRLRRPAHCHAWLCGAAAPTRHAGRLRRDTAALAAGSAAGTR